MPIGVYQRPPLRERFEAKYVVVPSGCWEWTAGTWGGGYGRIRDNGHDLQAHRVAYELHVGEIPKGFDLDHLCRNRACVNPEHLEPVTRRENLLRGDTIPARHARKTHCANGHAYDEENTYRWHGARFCRRCRSERRVKAVTP